MDGKMKLLLITFISTLISTSSLADTQCSELTDVKEKMQCELTQKINEENRDSDGYVNNIKCTDAKIGFYCKVELEFIDVDMSSARASAYKCNENYFYFGSNVDYQIQCSDCWFNESERYYRKSCK
jgi:hypothetical protein